MLPKRITCALLGFCLVGVCFYGQETSLLDELNKGEEEVSKKITYFKSSRVILGPSVRQLAKGELQFRVSHLFGRISDGIQELYGLDQVFNVDIAFDYGLIDRLSLGLARSSDFDKTLQSNIKYSILQQSLANKAAFSLSYVGSINIRTRNYEVERDFVDRLEYVNQLLLACKFSDRLAGQLAPGFIHLNRVPTTKHPNSFLLTSLGVSYSVSPSASVNIEYQYIYPTFDSSIYDTRKNGLSIGMDIDTGGHVFQLFVTNATRLQTSGFVQQWNNDNFFKGDIHFGFSIMRSFNL